MKLYTLIQRVTSLMVLLACGINCYGMLQPKAGVKRPLDESLQELETTETKHTKEENIISQKGSASLSAIESLPQDVRKLIIQALAHADDHGRAEQLQALLQETPVKVQDLGKNREADLYAAAEAIRTILMNNRLFKSILDDQKFTGHLISNLATIYKLPVVDAALALGTDSAARWIAHTYDEKGDIKNTAWERIWQAGFSEEMSVLRFLLTYASDKNKAYLIKTPFNRISLIEFAVNNNNPKLVKYLLAQNMINIEPHDNKPNSFLYTAALRGYQEIFDELIKAGALINQRSEDNKTALHAAVEHNHLPIVKRLIELKADLNLQDATGYTPLMRAIEKNYEAIAKELIAANANININDKKQRNALLFAIFIDNPALVEQLIAAGADVNVSTINKHSALWHARNRYSDHQEEIIKLLIDSGAKE
jgi:hypothetical protein